MINQAFRVERRSQSDVFGDHAHEPHRIFCGGSHSWDNGAMNKKATKFSPEVRERAVRLVREQRSEHPSMWAAVESIAPMIGCTPQTLHEWIKRDQVDQGERDGVTTDERERLKALEREVKELRRANEILKVASAFFAQAELDRRFKS